MGVAPLAELRPMGVAYPSVVPVTRKNEGARRRGGGLERERVVRRVRDGAVRVPPASSICSAFSTQFSWFILGLCVQ